MLVCFVSNRGSGTVALDPFLGSRDSFCIVTRVFNSGRLGVNTPKTFSPYAQILRRGRHDVQSNLLHMFICL